jgi:hypothetical protein
MKTCYLTSHPQVQSWGVIDSAGVSPQEGKSSSVHQTYWHALNYESHHLKSCHWSLVSSGQSISYHIIFHLLWCLITQKKAFSFFPHLNQSQFLYAQMVVQVPTSPTTHPSVTSSKLPHIAACYSLWGCSGQRCTKSRCIQNLLQHVRVMTGCSPHHEWWTRPVNLCHTDLC